MMSREVLDIMRVADVVSKCLTKMASEGKIEAAAVNVKNLSWVVDMHARESWLLTIDNVESSTVTQLVPGLIHELELIGLGWDDWDIYTEFPDENGTCIPTT